MKTNNIASYSDVLVTCMRQNPRWILLAEVRSAEAVMAVRNSISSGHNILSTLHADRAESIPNRLYSLLESNIDLEQFLRSIHRYVQLGVHIKGYYSKELQRFKREVAEVVEFYVTDDTNEPKCNIIYKRTPDGKMTLHNPTKYLLDYLESQGVIMPSDILVKEEFHTPEDDTSKNVDINRPVQNPQAMNFNIPPTNQPVTPPVPNPTTITTPPSGNNLRTNNYPTNQTSPNNYRPGVVNYNQNPNSQFFGPNDIKYPN